MTVTVNADSKLNAITCFPIDRHRRKRFYKPLNEAELRSFRYFKSQIGWIATTASLFCALYTSWLQQKSPGLIVKDLVDHINYLKLLKKLRSTTSYIRPPIGIHQMSVLVLADGNRKNDYGQLCFLCGIIVGKLSYGSVFHPISWVYHKSRRPVKSVASAEILAAGEAIDEGKVVVNAFNDLLGLDLDLWIAVDSKDLFSSLSTCPLAADGSIRGDVSFIRFDFFTKTISQIIQVPGSINLADPGTKTDSNLAQTLQILLVSEYIPIDFSEAVFQSSDQFTG